MSATPGALSLTLPILVKLLRVPGKLMLIAHSVIIGILAITAYYAHRNFDGFWPWVPTAFAVFFALGLAVFAWRRQRLMRHVDDLERLQQGTRTLEGGAELIPAEGSSSLGVDRQQWEQRLSDARTEADSKRKTFMPRVESAQRAAVAAAGGTVNAPYLKDDLRVTLVAALISLAAGPIGGALAFITFLAVV